MQISINANRCEPSPMRKFHPYAVEAEKKGKKIYHLNIGQPDLPTPTAYYDAVRNFDRKTLAYAESPGMPVLIDISNYLPFVRLSRHSPRPARAGRGRDL